MKIEIEIPDYFEGSHEDGIPSTSLQEMVVEAIVRRLLDTTRREDWMTTTRERVQAIRDEEIREAVRPSIEAALLKAVQPTDSYGMPKGDPLTLHEVIVKQATDWLTKPESQRYGEKAVSPVQRLINEEVGRVFAAEVGQALKEAKAEVKQAVQAQGAQVLAETITRMANH